ncbi:MAG: hypothetical protein KGL45_09880 [Gammaproteobacteria bacterium]|nr:hypothetical protein [Gammaproteobacteria bacterium]
MVRLSVVVVAVLCAGGAAFAQAPPSAAPADWQARHQQWEQQWQQKRAQMEQKRMERLSVLLDMSPAQKQQVQAILAAERTRMQQARKQAAEARRAAHADALAKLGSVLSPAQMKKLQLLMPQHRHRFFSMRRGRMGMRSPMGMWGPPVHGDGPPPPPPPGPRLQ